MEFSTYQIFIAFLLSLLAGISTCIGAVAVFFLKKDSPKVLSIGLSFSAGVMIYISFMEILPEAFEGFSSLNLGIWDKILGLVCFFMGILLSALVDKLIPNDLHKQEQNAYKELKFELVAGIMVYISFDELLPAAKFYGKAHHCLYGLLVGMGVMAFSLLLLNG